MNREIIIAPAEAGLSRAVADLQAYLHNHLPWLEKSFGLASDGYTVSAEKITLTYPEVYIGQGEYDPVLPDDRYASQVFYYADSAERVTEAHPYGSVYLEVDLSIVVWLDLDQLKAAMGYGFEHRYTDELKEELLAVLNQYGAFAAETVDTKAARVWAGWNIGRGILYYGDIKEYAISQIGKHPQAGFRVRGVLSYEKACGPAPVYVGDCQGVTIYINNNMYIAGAGETIRFTSDFEITPDLEITIQRT